MSLAARLFVQKFTHADNKENIKAQHYWPFWKEIHQMLKQRVNLKGLVMWGRFHVMTSPLARAIGVIIPFVIPLICSLLLQFIRYRKLVIWLGYSNQPFSLISVLCSEQNGRHSADYILSGIYLNETFVVLIQNPGEIVPCVLLNYRAALVKVMAWRRTGTKPFLYIIMAQLTDTYMRQDTFLNGLINEGLYGLAASGDHSELGSLAEPTLRWAPTLIKRRLVQGRRNSFVSALGLLLPCTNPSIHGRWRCHRSQNSFNSGSPDINDAITLESQILKC